MLHFFQLSRRFRRWSRSGWRLWGRGRRGRGRKWRRVRQWRRRWRRRGRKYFDREDKEVGETESRNRGDSDQEIESGSEWRRRKSKQLLFYLCSSWSFRGCMQIANMIMSSLTFCYTIVKWIPLNSVLLVGFPVSVVVHVDRRDPRAEGEGWTSSLQQIHRSQRPASQKVFQVTNAQDFPYFLILFSLQSNIGS